MAKVCHVPSVLSIFAWSRVKIFSLVAKKCREKNFMIPVLQRAKKVNDTIASQMTLMKAPLSSLPALAFTYSYRSLGLLFALSQFHAERNLTPECYYTVQLLITFPGLYLSRHITSLDKDAKGKIIRNFDGTSQKEHHRFSQEIITDEQINAELKNVFDKFRADADKVIDQINKQTTITDDNKKDITTYHKTQLDIKLKEADVAKHKQKLVAMHQTLIEKLNKQNKLTHARKRDLDGEREG